MLIFTSKPVPSRFFGPYGGIEVPNSLASIMSELSEPYLGAKDAHEFLAELQDQII